MWLLAKEQPNIATLMESLRFCLTTTQKDTV